MPDRLFRRHSRGFWADTVHAVMMSLLVFPAGLIFVAVFYAAPLIETQYFPVLTPMHILSVRPAPGGSLVEAEATKLRGNCAWKQTLWYFGTRAGLSVPLPAMGHRDKPQLRSAGLLHWDNIFIPLPPEDIPNTFGDAYHACLPWGWWSRSEVYQ